MNTPIEIIHSSHYRPYDCHTMQMFTCSCGESFYICVSNSLTEIDTEYIIEHTCLKCKDHKLIKARKYCNIS